MRLVRASLVMVLGVSLALGVSACSRTEGDDDDVSGDGGGFRDSATGDGGVIVGSVTIQNIQKGEMGIQKGSIVSVTGAVVTHVRMRTCGAGVCFDAWAQEAAGGANSGVLLFGIPMNVATTLARGDEVSFTGEVDEFMAGGATPDTDSVTEVKISAITKTGTGKTIVVTTITPAMLGAKATAEQWEGVMVKVENFLLSSAFRSAGVTISWYMYGGGQVDDELVALPQGPRAGACVAFAQGVLHYFYGYKIYPRDVADLNTADGTGCPPSNPETTMTECTDMIDNDFDGFKDCNNGMFGFGDFSCEAYCASTATPNPTPMAMTVAMARTYVIPASGTIPIFKLTDVFVTAVDTRANPVVSGSAVNSIWVSDTANASPGTGVMVFQPNEGMVSGFTVGQKVTVYGKPTDFLLTMGGTEREIGRDAFVTGAIAGSAPVPVALTSLTAAGNEMYEGSLVTIALVKALVAPNANGETALTLQNNTESLLMTDNIIDLASVTANSCFVSVTGIIRHGRCGATGAFTACYKLDATALTTRTTCP